MRTSLSQPPVAWNGMQEFPADEVKATVSKGWVTLRGEVEWQYQKQDAEEVVRRLTGVMGVTCLGIAVRTSSHEAYVSSVARSVSGRAERQSRYERMV